jgi:hypothetical protein
MLLARFCSNNGPLHQIAPDRPMAPNVTVTATVTATVKK